MSRKEPVISVAGFFYVHEVGAAGAIESREPCSGTVDANALQSPLQRSDAHHLQVHEGYAFLDRHLHGTMFYVGANQKNEQLD